MPFSIPASHSGTQTATLNTDHTLRSLTGPAGGALYQLRVDTANLANGERVILTMRVNALDNGTLRTVYQTVHEHVQSSPIKDSPIVGVPVDGDLEVILRQEGGTGRAFPWALFRVDA